MSLETLAGTIRGEVRDDVVGVEMSDVEEVKTLSVECEYGRYDLFFVNTGVPHAVLFVEDLEGQDVTAVGRAIRFHPEFQPEGTNVDFALRSPGNEISIRTYERGVEDETLSCGTGSVAAAMAHSRATGVRPPITVRARSGEALAISFVSAGEGFREVFMKGPVRKVFEGTFFL